MNYHGLRPGDAGDAAPQFQTVSETVLLVGMRHIASFSAPCAAASVNLRQPDLGLGDAAASGFTLLFMLPFGKLIDLQKVEGC